MSDLIGRTLGPYHIIGEVGHGGMANVYLAEQSSIGRQVAIKVLPTHFLQDRSFLERFEREVKVIAKLQHPRILPVYDYGNESGLPYIVMAYMTGGTLTERIKSQNGLGLDEAARLVEQIGEGLDYAHSKGIIHRDFKPSNVLLDGAGNAHLADFGIAKMTESTSQLTGSGIVGTPHYMAPEMSSSSGLSHLVDIYAVGVTLYQMLTGHLPYDAPTPMGVLMQHMSQSIPDVRVVRGEVPDAVQAVIEKAMAKDPSQRFQHMAEMSAALESAISAPGRAPTDAPRPVGAETHRASMSEIADRMAAPAAAAPPAVIAPRAAPKQGGGMSPVLVVGGIFGVLICAAIAIFAFIAASSPKTTSPADQTATAQANSTGTAAAIVQATDSAATAAEFASQTAVAERNLAVAAEATATVKSANDELAAIRRETPLYGPESGSLTTEADQFLEVALTDVSVRDFLADVTFKNPANLGDSWSYGLLFRYPEGNQQYRLILASDSTWLLSEAAGDISDIDSGAIDRFTTTPGRLNKLTILARGTEGILFVNDELVAFLDLSARTTAGDIAVGIDFFQGDEDVISTFEYTGFTIWDLD